MPYISQSRRDKLDDQIEELRQALVSQGSEAGDMNYSISKLITEIFHNNKRYDEANKILGVIRGVELEFYRKHVAPYEDVKELENGPII